MIHPTNKQGIETSQFGVRNGQMHAGIDIAIYGNKQGTPILSAWSGKVTRSSKGCLDGNLKCGNGGGNWIEITHSNNYKTRYLHLQKNFVSVGQSVKAGQVIGTMGNTGYSTATHLHFEIWKNGIAQNPKSFIDSSQKIGKLIYSNNDNNSLYILGLIILIEYV